MAQDRLGPFKVVRFKRTVCLERFVSSLEQAVANPLRIYCE